MDLREQIAFELEHGGYLPLTIADSILSLPSGMEKVKECPKCLGLIFTLASRCPDCHGSGEIVTDLTIGEAIEWAKNEVQYKNDNFGSLNLPSGEIVRIKK